MATANVRGGIGFYNLCNIKLFGVKMKKTFSAVIVKGKIAFVALCPELGVVSQSRTEKTAIENLQEALELYLEDEDVKQSIKEGSMQKAKVCPISVSV